MDLPRVALADTTGPSGLLAALARAAEPLSAGGHPWALVGGLAVSVRVEPRFTRDIDLSVAVTSDRQAESVVSAFTASGFLLTTSLDQTALGRLAAVRLLASRESPDGVVVDLLFVWSGIEQDICREAEALEVVPGLVVPVARIGHLVAMKLLALSRDRPQDAVDLLALLQVITPQDTMLAIEAAAAIERVGANRGRDLRADLDTWLARSRA